MKAFVRNGASFIWTGERCGGQDLSSNGVLGSIQNFLPCVRIAPDTLRWLALFGQRCGRQRGWRREDRLKRKGACAELVKVRLEEVSCRAGELWRGQALRSMVYWTNHGVLLNRLNGRCLVVAWWVKDLNFRVGAVAIIAVVVFNHCRERGQFSLDLLNLNLRLD